MSRKSAQLTRPVLVRREGCSGHDLREDAVWFMTGRGMDVLEYVSRDRVHSSSPPATSTRSNGSLSPFISVPPNLQAAAPTGATAAEIDTEYMVIISRKDRQRRAGPDHWDFQSETNPLISLMNVELHRTCVRFGCEHRSQMSLEVLLVIDWEG